MKNATLMVVAEVVSSSAGELANMAEELQNLLSKFKV